MDETTAATAMSEDERGYHQFVVGVRTQLEEQQKAANAIMQAWMLYIGNKYGLQEGDSLEDDGAITRQPTSQPAAEPAPTPIFARGDVIDDRSSPPPVPERMTATKGK